MNNKDIKQRIINIFDNHSNDFSTALDNSCVYLSALEGIPPTMQSLPLSLYQDYCDGKINNEQGFEKISELLKNTPY
ncbi:MAG: hypothetical protein AB8B80_07950 [Marinicellaceae bacterium]